MDILHATEFCKFGHRYGHQWVHGLTGHYKNGIVKISRYIISNILKVVIIIY